MIYIIHNRYKINFDYFKVSKFKFFNCSFPGSSTNSHVIAAKVKVPFSVPSSSLSCIHGILFRVPVHVTSSVSSLVLGANW